MINATDIEAFEQFNREAMAAVDESIRRAEKGLPEDRLFRGADGVKLALQGAWAYRRMTELYRDALLLMLEEQKRASQASMEATPDPMRG